MKSTVTKILRVFFLFMFLFVGLYVMVSMLTSSGESKKPKEVPTLDSLDKILKTDKIEKVVINSNSKSLIIFFKEGRKWKGYEEIELSYPIGYEEKVTKQVLNSGTKVEVEPLSTGGGFGMGSIIMIMVVIFIIIIFLRIAKASKGGVNPMGDMKNSKYKNNKDKSEVGEKSEITFADVASAEEAIEEVREVVDFLKNPEKFTKLGAKIPKGVLLYGPPGCGKTLIARAVAGEADVPFFRVSGSDFIQMYVGVGAARVRDLFKNAKKSGSSIVFIDEIDSIGQQRFTGIGVGNDEREQTLNQLLNEMDGFDKDMNVIVFAATNRPDVLDPALLRPGRFDRQVVVHAPDLKGRIKILEVHAKGKTFSDDVDLTVVAKNTHGFTGADLANLINEAAILAARRELSVIRPEEIESAIDRVLAGPENKSRIISEEERRIIAYHESGHALVGHALKGVDPINKVTIVSRGMALGYTQSLPQEDRYLYNKNQFLDQITMFLGGRASEAFIFGDITSGAQNDIEHATEIAREMVTQFGMNDELGPMQYGKPTGSVFLGRDLSKKQDYSETTSYKIDNAIRDILDKALKEASSILIKYKDALESMVIILLEKETIKGDEIDEVLKDVPLNGIVRDKNSCIEL